jgi:hypothetical protein
MQTLILLFKDMRTILSKADSIDFNKNALLKNIEFFYSIRIPPKKEISLRSLQLFRQHQKIQYE